MGGSGGSGGVCVYVVRICMCHFELSGNLFSLCVVSLFIFSFSLGASMCKRAGIPSADSAFVRRCEQWTAAVALRLMHDERAQQDDATIAAVIDVREPNILCAIQAHAYLRFNSSIFVSFFSWRVSLSAAQSTFDGTPTLASALDFLLPADGDLTGGRCAVNESAPPARISLLIKSFQLCMVLCGDGRAEPRAAARLLALAKRVNSQTSMYDALHVPLSETLYHVQQALRALLPTRMRGDGD